MGPGRRPRSLSDASPSDAGQSSQPVRTSPTPPTPPSIHGSTGGADSPRSVGGVDPSTPSGDLQFLSL